ncbi:MAG: CDP-alcohol phosphatidyltransferase family protein [Longimicrobiales bacterium]|nr:CDP-alcohol phosphatidyltransferase family protein [Longimicrobiales bacterium]
MTVLLWVVGFALATIPIFALSGARRRPDALASSAHGSFVLGDFIVRWLYWFVDPVIRLALALRLGPTAFNIAGAILGGLAGAFFAFGHFEAAGWCVLLGGVADILDGRIARAQGVADARGAFLDSTLDRFAEVGAFVGVIVLYRESALAVTLCAIALGGSLLVSYARARGESQGVVCSRGVMQRAERLLLLGIGALVDPLVAAHTGLASGTLLLILVGIIAAGTLGTAIYRTVAIAGALARTDA